MGDFPKPDLWVSGFRDCPEEFNASLHFFQGDGELCSFPHCGHKHILGRAIGSPIFYDGQVWAYPAMVRMLWDYQKDGKDLRLVKGPCFKSFEKAFRMGVFQ